MGSPESEALLRRVGVRPLATATALAGLEALAVAPVPQVIVADIDWALFKGSYEARGHRRLLERMADGAVATAPAAIGDSGLMRRIDAAPASDRERLVSAVVQDEVAQVLALPEGSRPDLEQGLFEMGLDSLMALELRTRLQTRFGRSLAPTLVFDCPTIGAMARFLLAGATAGPVPAPALRTATMAKGEASGIEALSDADAEMLLLQRLESIH